MTEIECQKCGWSGDSSELVSTTDDLNDRDFSHCPYCGRTEFIDYDDEESYA